MNVLLSRILRYLNGTIVYDNLYKFSKAVITHYLEMYDLTEQQLQDYAGLTKEEFDECIKAYRYETYEQFRSTLISNHEIRLDQIRARMLDISSEALIDNMEKSCSNEEMFDYISTICEAIDKAKKIVIVAAYYPVSLAVELQTDLITFGKTVLTFRHFDPEIDVDENDVTIFISATGRAMKSFMKNKDYHANKSTSILITQNKIYTMDEHKISDYVIHVPGKFDGINFNYQIMAICDLLRVHYYQQYYL